MATRTYSLAINCNSAGQFTTNVLHYNFDDSGFSTTAAAAQALCNAWDLANRGAFRALIPTDVTMLTLRSRLVTGIGGFEAVKILTGAAAGTRAGTQSASGLAPCLILYPANNGKQRGRIFLPGVSEGDVVDGIFTAAFQTAVLAQISTLFANITLVGGGAPTAQQVIYNRVARTGALIEWIQLSDMLGTIRRRQLPV